MMTRLDDDVDGQRCDSDCATCDWFWVGTVTSHGGRQGFNNTNLVNVRMKYGLEKKNTTLETTIFARLIGLVYVYVKGATIRVMLLVCQPSRTPPPIRGLFHSVPDFCRSTLTLCISFSLSHLRASHISRQDPTLHYIARQCFRPVKQQGHSSRGDISASPPSPKCQSTRPRHHQACIHLAAPSAVRAATAKVPQFDRGRCPNCRTL